jgi:hypothetical protein
MAWLCCWQAVPISRYICFQALAKQTSELSRVGALEALATLSLTFGGQLGSSIPESVSIAAKQCYR